MAKNFQWRATTGFQSDPGPDYYLSHGVIPANQEDWQTAQEGAYSPGQYIYYYRDSNTSYAGQWVDTISSRVAFKVTQTWVASYDNMNVLTITINTVIDSIARDDIRGSDQNTPGRHIEVYDRDSTGTPFFTYDDYQVATAHNISGTITLPQSTIVLQPGSSVAKPSLVVFNQTIGGQSFDEIWVGVEFRNPLPSPVTYTVNYNANGGSPTPSPQSAVSVEDSYTFTINGTTQWGHYKFLGWSHTQYHDSRTDADVEYHVGDTITLTRLNPTTILYAVWMMDYRPGATLDTNTSVWKSHNRTDGACHVLSNTSNMTWQECRTIGGAEGDKGNPPLILTAPNANSWRNQKLLGKE